MAKEEKKTINLTTPIIVLLVALAAFFAGMQAKDMLAGRSSGGQAQKQNQAGGQPSPAAPNQQEPEKMVLSEAEWTKVKQNGAAVKGSPGGPVTIVEFSEYECPFCQRYVQDTYGQLMEEYGDQVYYVFHDYPLPFHQHAQLAAEAARCAGDQGQYWGMHDLLFDDRDWTTATDVEASLAGYAADLGLNKNSFVDCLSSGKFTQAVKDDSQLGQSVGVSGTPTFFINGQKLVGAQPFTNFQVVLDQLLGE